MLEFGARRLRALRFREAGGRVSVEAAASLEERSPGEALRRLGKDGWFGGTRVLLGVRQRDTAVMQRPPVDDAELPGAMRWQLADTLPYPPDQAIVDVLTFQDDEPPARQQVMVVATHRPKLAELLRPLAGKRQMRPDVIDVADCAQRNLVEASCGPQRSAACLTHREGAVLFTVSRGRTLLFSRVFDVQDPDDARDSADETVVAERIGVQLQRAIDVLERRSPEAAPTRMLVGPSNDGALMALIAELCGLPLVDLDWHAHVDVAATARADIEADPALVHLVGAAMRAPKPEAVDA
ncbi:MAG: hypothetical protein ACOYLX_12960 [Burkholderiaceae bacterium]